MGIIPVWVKNLCQMQVSKEEMETINSPKLEYARHVTFATAEALTIVGMISGAVPDRFSKAIVMGSAGIFRKQVFMRGIGVGGTVGCALGCIIGPVASLFVMKGLRMSEIYEKCYELRHDQADILRDRWALIGWFVGVTNGFLFRYQFKLVNMTALGGVTGISAGSLAGVLASLVLVSDSEELDNWTYEESDSGTTKEFNNSANEVLDNRTREELDNSTHE